MEEFYAMLGITKDSTIEEIDAAFDAYKARLKARYDAGELNDNEFLAEFQKAMDAYTTVRTYRKSLDDEAAEIERENNGEVVESGKGKKTVRNLIIFGAVAAILATGYVHTKNYGWRLGHQAGYDEGVNRNSKGAVITSADPEVEAQRELTDEQLLLAQATVEPKKETPVATVKPEEKKAEATAKPEKKKAEATAKPEEKKAEATAAPTSTPEKVTPSELLFGEEEPKVTEVPVQPTAAPTVAPTAAHTAEPTAEPVVEFVAAPDYGDVQNEQLVLERATVWAQRAYAAGITNPATELPYTPEDIVRLVQFAHGVYVPETKEEIDLLYEELLNFLISPINSEGYLFHIAYANGADELLTMVPQDMVHIGFADVMAKYGNNGVYPLVQWLDQKMVAIFSTTDRTVIDGIIKEVGQVMADIMKGNGCTIEVDGQTYHFTSEQILAHPASAAVVSVVPQIIFANHDERREGSKVVEHGTETWEVYNFLNANGVDADGKPIYEPDVVTLDEIQYWINTTCVNGEALEAYQAIDPVLNYNGYTFSQIIQMNIEGLALNNYEINHGHGLKKTN
jgi:hypothetical protein